MSVVCKCGKRATKTDRMGPTSSDWLMSVIKCECGLIYPAQDISSLTEKKRSWIRDYNKRIMKTTGKASNERTM